MMERERTLLKLELQLCAHCTPVGMTPLFRLILTRCAAGCFQNLVNVIIARITIVITIVICAGKTKARKHVLNA
jgi:hypothetical protein